MSGHEKVVVSEGPLDCFSIETTGKTIISLGTARHSSTQRSNGRKFSCSIVSTTRKCWWHLKMNEWINDRIFTYEIGMRKRKIVLADKFRWLISVGNLLSSVRHPFLRHNRADRLTSSFIHRIFNNVTNRHLSRTYYRRIKQVSNVNRSACFLWWAINTPRSLWYFGGNLYGMPRRQFIWNTVKVRVVYSIERALETCCVLKWLFRFKLVRYRLISNCAKLKSNFLVPSSGPQENVDGIWKWMSG